MTAGGRNSKSDHLRSCAIRMVKKDGQTIRATSEALGVSPSTIRDWVVGNRPKGVEAKLPESVRLLSKWPKLKDADEWREEVMAEQRRNGYWAGEKEDSNGK